MTTHLWTRGWEFRVLQVVAELGVSHQRQLPATHITGYSAASESYMHATGRAARRAQLEARATQKGSSTSELRTVPRTPKHVPWKDTFTVLWLLRPNPFRIHFHNFLFPFLRKTNYSSLITTVGVEIPGSNNPTTGLFQGPEREVAEELSPRRAAGRTRAVVTHGELTRCQTLCWVHAANSRL